MQQALVNKVEQVQDAASTAVAVGGGVDRLELIIRHSESNQRVYIDRFVDLACPVDELIEQQVFDFGRRIRLLLRLRRSPAPCLMYSEYPDQYL